MRFECSQSQVALKYDFINPSYLNSAVDTELGLARPRLPHQAEILPQHDLASVAVCLQPDPGPARDGPPRPRGA